MSRKAGDFWKEQEPTGYLKRTDDKQRGTMTRGEARQKVHRPKKISLRAALLIFLVPLAIVLVLHFFVFRVRKIQVTGNTSISDQEVIRFSGIRYGDSIFGLNEDEIERQMLSRASAAAGNAANPDPRLYRLQFSYLEKELPGTVTIAVKEREYCCWMTANGFLFVMDKTGMILFETQDIDMRPAYPQVKGLAIRSGMRAGQTIGFTFGWQEDIYRELFLEIKVTGCIDLITEADLSKQGSILLETKDGFTVSLGSADKLHAKLHSMLQVRQYLTGAGKSGGTINVSDPEEPSWSPPSV